VVDILHCLANFTYNTITNKKGTVEYGFIIHVRVSHASHTLLNNW